MNELKPQLDELIYKCTTNVFEGHKYVNLNIKYVNLFEKCY